ncbi:MAG: choice-of-anchor Q domain-containing protein, partial [Planctomycetota bacterium]
YDLDGNPRIINRTVDMGAYEGSNQGFLLNTKSILVPEGGATTFTVALAMDPEATVEVTVAVESGDPDIVIQSGATLTFKSGNYSHPQIVTLAAAEDDGHLNGTAIIEVSAAGFFAVRLSASEWDNDPPTILYVDDSAKGAERGTSWANAFTDLQDALSMAEMIPQIEEIRVAQGLYTPAEPAGDRRETFQLINGVAIKGGYAGSGHPKPNTRNIHIYKTILSGDLNGDDGPDFTNNAENSYHVVTGTLADETSILDAFTITGGNANGPYPKHNEGGGMYNDYGSPTLANCTFNANSAGFGGGLYNMRRSSPNMIKCTFSYNSASSGGGVYNDKCKPRLSKCVFIGNSAKFKGGGMCNDSSSSSPILNNCVFINNLAASGGGMFNWYGMPKITNCTYTGNSARYYGGGMWNNTWFGRYMPILTNCILWDNTDSTSLYESAQIYGGGIVNYSCIQGWQGALGGIGNFGADPCFVTPGYWDANEIWVDGDYHLLEDSPCINAGDPNYIAGPDETDLEGKPRILLGRIDMGAHEYSPSIAAEVKIIPRTINLASEGKWIDCYIWPPEEYNVADIDVNSILLRGKLEPQGLRIDEERQVAVAWFNRSEVQGFLNVGRFDIIIFGQLTDGTVFAGADTIRVVDKSGKK